MSKYANLKDMTGQRFGRLAVLRLDGMAKKNSPWKGRKSTGAYWLCQCDCGAEVMVHGSSLRSGNSKSCGCLNKERVIATHTKHGKSKARIYKLWTTMVQRCTNPKNTKYYMYGANGIEVCERWLDFENFYADMGDKPAGMSIDRIDGTKGYNPENCRWATNAEQAYNKKIRVDNRFGIAGVHRYRYYRGGKYVVKIGRSEIGITPDFFEACCIRKSAEVRLLA